MLRSLFHALSWFVLIGCSARDTLAQDKVDHWGAPEATAAQRELVQRLGASSFHTRQRAAAKLASQGLEAEAALVEALEDPDLEIRLRARHILSRVREDVLEARLAAFIADVDGKQRHELPGWKSFRDLVGDSRKAREMFATMTRHEAALLSAYEKQVPEMPELFAARIAWLKLKAKSGNWDLRVDSRPLLATLLLIGCDNNVKDHSKRVFQLYQLLCEAAAMQSIGTGAQPPVLRTLLEKLATNAASGRSYYGLSLALKYNLRETGLQQATKLLEGETTSSLSLLRYAIVTVGRFGGEEHARLLTPLLENKTVCNRWGNPALKKQGTINTELRDVALVVLLRLRGKDPKQYGFKLLQENPETLYHSYTCGFVDDEEREAAHAKWAAESNTDKS